MKTHIQNTINYFTEHPSKIFLLDGLGAVVSAFLLGVVLRSLQPLIGMSDSNLIYLAIAPCFFAVFSFFCSWRKPNNWKNLLLIIAIANTVYCAITFSLLFISNEPITKLGYFYFITEIIIVMSLVYVEYKVATSKSN